MSLNPLPSELGLGGGAGLHDHEVRQLRDAILELQSQTVSVVTGGAANANLTLTGVAVGDTLGSVIEYEAGVPVDRTSVSVVTAANTIQVNNITTGNVLVVTWYAKP
jgi:maleate cis-trans isomerase